MAGQIQSSINNILGMAAVAKKLDPKAQAEAQKQAELENLDAREGVLRDRFRTLSQTFAGDKDPKDMTPEEVELYKSRTLADRDELDDIMNQHLDVAKRRYELSPSKETYGAYRELSAHRKMVDSARNMAYDSSRQEQAMADMQSQADSMSAQKDKYKRHMDINAMYDKVKKGEITQDEYESWFSALPNSQPDDDRDFDNAVGR